MTEAQQPDVADPTRFDSGFAGYRQLELVSGAGAHVFDAAGRRYLDATSQYGVTSLGHAHPDLTRAIAEQAGRMVSCFASFANDRRAELQAKLAGLLAPLDRFFLCNSGTEAVEATLKLARATTGRHGVLALAGGFHGRSLGALSATHQPRHRQSFAPLLEGFRHVRPGAIEALEEALDDSIGLVLLETIQGEGGVRVLSDEYLTHARRLARERGALFAVDEVQTGIGRTGRMFGFQHADLEPDLVCLAKGLAGGFPIGAVGYRHETVSLKGGAHGSTFGGNPLAAAAAGCVLEVVERDGLVEHARVQGELLLEQLRRALKPGEGRVRDVRGRGLMIGIELTDPAVPVQRELQARGFLVLGAGPRVIRLLPPLITAPEDLAALGEAVAEAIQC